MDEAALTAGAEKTPPAPAASLHSTAGNPSPSERAG
jgi:hypothetical protein